MRNHSYGNNFDLHENETARRTYFHLKGFTLRLVLKQRHKRAGKWPVDLVGYEDFVSILSKPNLTPTQYY